MADDDGRRPAHGRDPAGIPDRIAGATGAAPAQSALTLRLVLACFGFVLFTVTAALFAWLRLPAVLIVVAAALAVIALADLVVITWRRHRARTGRPKAQGPN
jgi:Flp pilus assembly protein TadB